MPQLSVIIPTFNRAAVLRRMLNLLAVQTLAASEWEVIVIDDGSTDETPRVLVEFQEKGIFNLKWESQANAGQGAARNRGFDLATGKILLILGDDMLPRPGLLEAHLRFHIHHPETEAAALGLVRWHPELAITRFMRWLDTSGTQFKFHDLQPEQTTDFWRFYTANISLKKELLGTERFDPDFTGWGFEDTELGLRLEKKGMKLLYYPDALVEHLHAISAEGLAERQRSAGRNAALFQSKHPEIAIIPRGWKYGAQWLLSRVFFWTFWAQAKRAFLAGISEAK